MIRLTLLNLSYSSNTKKFVNSVRRQHTKSNGLSYYHNNGHRPLIYRTIGQELGRVAEEHGDREAVVAVEEKKKLTFKQLKDQADHLAAGFLSLGFKPGDRLGLWAPNVISWPVVFLAAVRAGLIVVALNPAYEPPEMKYCLQKVGVKAIVTSESFREKQYYESLLKIVPELCNATSVKISCKEIPSLSHVFVDTKSNLKGVLHLDEVASMSSNDQIEKIDDLQNSISPDSCCNIQLTSGTTGNPKAALLKHMAFVNNGTNFGDHLNMTGKRICVQVPFFHVYGSVASIVGSMCHAATMVIPSITYNSEKSLKTIKNERCSIVYGTPTMHIDLVRKQREMRLDLNVEIAVSGGALCPPQLIRDLRSELGVKTVKNAYGMTENSAVSFGIHQENNTEESLNSVGKVLDHVEAKVIDKEGNLVPFGTSGQLCVRGYFTMIGYWDDDAKTKEVLGPDGWLKTGDQFILHENGHGEVVGRFKDIIIRGGENIFPREIEDILMTAPQIAEAYVVGVPDERLGEDLCAFIRLREGVQNYALQDIRDFCKGKISYFKIPRYVEIVKDFPKTLSGKVQKFKLREQFKINKN